MKEKTKLVTIDGVTYQLKRFMPDVGSFILGRVLNAGATATIQRMKALGDILADIPQPTTPPEEVDVDTQIRRTASTAFGAMTFEERTQIQRKCMEACARMEEDAPMPVSNANGMILDDLTLVMRLELEVLVFNFHDFFAEGGLNALLKTPAPQS